MNRKQIKGGIILSGISQTISVIVGLTYTPIMIRCLGQTEYGLYQLVLSLVNYLNLMNFGFNGAYIRYYTIAKEKSEDAVKKINGMFLSVFYFIAFMCIAVGAFLYQNISLLGKQITGEEYILAKKLLVIMVLNMAASFPNSLYVAYMSARSEFIIQKAANIVFNILIPLFNLPLLYRGYGSVGIVSATLALTIVRLMFNMIYCHRELNMKIQYLYFDKNIFKSLFGYTFFIFLSDIVDQLNTNVDKFLLGRILGTVSVAIYSVAFNLKNYYTQLTWIIPEMYIPEINKEVISEKSDEKVNKTFIKVGRYNNYIVLLVLSGFILFGQKFIELWVGNEYATAYYVGVILMLCGYVPAIQTLGVNIQNAKNMHRMRSIVYFIVACVNVMISVLLIHKWGVIGTSLGTLFAVILGNGVFMNYYYSKYIRLDIRSFWKAMIKWYPCVVSIVLIESLLLKYIDISSWSKLLLAIAGYTVLYVILLLKFELEPDEKKSLLTIAKKFLKERRTVK